MPAQELIFCHMIFFQTTLGKGFDYTYPYEFFIHNTYAQAQYNFFGLRFVPRDKCSGNLGRRVSISPDGVSNQRYSLLVLFFPIARMHHHILCKSYRCIQVALFHKKLSSKASRRAILPRWICLIAAIYLNEAALILVVLGGVLLGVGSVGFYMIWQRLFAAEDADSGNRDILVGTAYGTIFYYGLHLIPQAVTAFLIPLVFLPLFGLAAQLKSRETNRNQPMFEDIPYEHPHIYRQVMKDHWRVALCIGAVGFAPAS